MNFRKLAAVMLIFFISTLYYAAPASAELELRQIMQTLLGHMGLIVTGISTEDFDTIEKSAAGIAGHRTPPIDERMAIMEFLKDDSAGFKAADGVVHDSAARVAEAARNKDMYSVVEGYRDILAGCLDCHTKYRDRVLKHFY